MQVLVFASSDYYQVKEKPILALAIDGRIWENMTGCCPQQRKSNIKKKKETAFNAVTPAPRAALTSIQMRN